MRQKRWMRCLLLSKMLWLAEIKFNLSDLEISEVRERAARKGRNPQTGEEIEIAASKVPAFKPGKALKDAVK